MTEEEMKSAVMARHLNSQLATVSVRPKTRQNLKVRDLQKPHLAKHGLKGTHHGPSRHST